MDERLFYKPLPNYQSEQEIFDAIDRNEMSELITLPLAVGMNFPDWKVAQTVCLKLAESSDETVRANACLGLAYIAMTKERLEKRLVKPILLRELRTQTEMRWRIIDAIQDINRFLGWKMAQKQLQGESK